MGKTHGENMRRTYGRGFVVLLVVEVPASVCVFFGGGNLRCCFFVCWEGWLHPIKRWTLFELETKVVFPASVAPIYIIKCVLQAPAQHRATFCQQLRECILACLPECSLDSVLGMRLGKTER